MIHCFQELEFQIILRTFPMVFRNLWLNSFHEILLLNISGTWFINILRNFLESWIKFFSGTCFWVFWSLLYNVFQELIVLQFSGTFWRCFRNSYFENVFLNFFFENVFRNFCFEEKFCFPYRPFNSGLHKKPQRTGAQCYIFFLRNFLIFVIS